MPKGGKRPRAGRPKGTGHPFQSTIDKELLREELRKIVAGNLNEMVQAQIANAKGLKYLVLRDTRTGKFTRVSKEQLDRMLDGDNDESLTRIEVWDKDPSVQAFTDLLNRTIDKPIDAVQQIHSGAVTIKHELGD